MCVFSAAAAEEKLIGDESDGSRAPSVHLIPLLDEQGQKISPEDEPVLPFSMRKTCGTCHSNDEIGKGWHFSAIDANVEPGRKGQPWLYVDAASCTQIPISYRSWPGTFKPEEIGLRRWGFVKTFGRQMPGGIGEDLEAEEIDFEARWMVSGEVEINCMTCHNGNAGQDQAEYALQLNNENFRWAAAAACEFASVSGSAKKMADTYDYLMPGVIDDPKLVPPTVTYGKNAFDHKNRVFFDVGGKIDDERCYFCHSNVKAGKETAEKWVCDEDVHLTSGLGCVDCHREGTSHETIRGYEGESKVSGNPLAGVTSCRGCHIGEESSAEPEEGRLGGPVPVHAGIPPVHFERLTCTACHSGAWPEERTGRVKTARAHGLGLLNVNKSDDVLPHILSPVFAENEEGKIGPHNAVWPAFWGQLEGEGVTPIAVDIAQPIASKIITGGRVVRSGDWPSLSGEQIGKVLAGLVSEIGEGEPVYICGGKLYQLDEKGEVISSEHEAGEPYLWPIAHEVRPAAQSLGVRSCGDCHATDSPALFGKVVIDTPVEAERDLFRTMVEFMGVDAFCTKAFAFSFVFRPWFKVVTILSSAVLGLVLLLYGLRALYCIVKIVCEED